MSSGSTKSVVAAISANSLVTVAKFAGFAVSGSGAMLSEAIHSVADTTNQALLLLGLRRARRGPDERHPYGYGRERFFWGLVSALGIFFVGAGVTIYHGVHSLLHPEMPELTWITWLVLGISFAFEGAAGMVAVTTTFHDARRAGVSFGRYVAEGRDPTTLAVLLEDGAAVIGLLLAATGIGLTQATGWPGWDAAASILIGLLLAFVALFLVATNRVFLVGRSVDPQMRARVEGILSNDPVVDDVHSLRAVVQSVDRYRVAADVDFDGRVVASEVLRGRDLAAMRAAMADDEGLRRELGDFAEAVVQRLATDIDALESHIKEAVPEVRHVDLEVD